jgi:hypothetical protein
MFGLVKAAWQRFKNAKAAQKGLTEAFKARGHNFMTLDSTVHEALVKETITTGAQATIEHFDRIELLSFGRTNEIIQHYKDRSKKFDLPPTPPHLGDFTIGQYKLNGSIHGISGLIQFSTAEHEAIGRQLAGEVIYHAPPVEFQGQAWSVVLQTIDGQICKIALYRIEPTNSKACQTASETLQFWTEHFKVPAEQKVGRFFWGATDGNVVLQNEEHRQGFWVGFFVTSQLIGSLPLSGHFSIKTSDQALLGTNDTFKIIYATTTFMIVALFALWATGYLSWTTGAQIFTLWLLAPFGMWWSWPRGQRIYIWRAAISLLGIAAVTAIVANFQFNMVTPLVIYVAVSSGLLMLAKTVRGTKFASFYSLLVNCAAAYSIGFAIEILLLELRGIIPGHQPLPVFTWSVIGVTAFAIAAAAKPSRLLAAAPCWTIAALMIIYGALWGTDAVVLAGVGMILIGVVLLVLIPKEPLIKRPLWKRVQVSGADDLISGRDCAD